MEAATTQGRPPSANSRPAGRADALPAPGRLVSILPGVVAALVVAGLGSADGGYFATAWGPTTIGFLAASGVAVVAQPRLLIGLRALVLPGVLALLTLWTLASSTWGSPSEAIPETRRALLYTSAALALGLIVRRGATKGVLIGLWAGSTAVCTYGLTTRLFPERLGVFDPIAGYRLSEPVGYWNALGLLASLAMILAFGLAASRASLIVRLLAAASVVPLALTCYFTFSRGAWLALAAGLVIAVLLDPRRLNLGLALVTVGPGAALAVLLAARSGPLTESGAHTLADAAKDGRALAAVAVGLGLFAAGTVAIVAALEPRMRIAPVAQRVGSGAVFAAAVALIIGAVLMLGGPVAIARSFAADPPAETRDLDDRLFSLSGTRRVDLWRVGRDVASEHRVLGSGAGSFQRSWLERRPYEAPVLDAHTLYVEMLAELGPTGLAFIVVLFGFPLVLAVMLRRRPLVPIAAAVLVAYLARAGIDWDWEFPVLTLVALGSAGVIVAEGMERIWRPSRWARLALFCAVLALVPVVAIATLGSRAEAASRQAFDDRDFDRAAAEAETAERFSPWSVEPLVLLGRAQAAAGDKRSARMTFTRGAAREPAYWRVWYELAAVSKGERRASALRRARALNPLESQLADLEEGP